VLLGLPADLLVELGGGHDRDGDLANDDRLAIDANRHVLLRNLAVGEDLQERLGDHARVHDVTVDDRLRWQGGVAVADDAESLAVLFELDHFDRARPDVDADQVLPFGHGYSFTARSGRTTLSARESARVWSVAPALVERQKTSESREHVRCVQRSAFPVVG